MPALEAAEPEAERRKALAREFLDVFATRDADAILARMTEDPCWVFWGEPRPGVCPWHSPPQYTSSISITPLRRRCASRSSMTCSSLCLMLQAVW